MAATKSEKGWAVVTGASSGIGMVFARELALQGYPVLAVARRLDRLQKLAADAAQKGGRIEVLSADLQTSEGVQAVVQRTDELGAVELLINNAGFATWGAFSELPLDREIDLLRLNIEALVTLTRQLLPSMMQRGYGGVINMGTEMSFQPMPYFATYAASKAFVLSFSEAIAYELRGSGVKVSVVCPGPTKTEFADITAAHAFQNSIPNLSPEQVVAVALRAYRHGQVIKVVGTVNSILAFMHRLMPRPVMRSLMASFTKLDLKKTSS